MATIISRSLCVQVKASAEKRKARLDVFKADVKGIYEQRKANMLAIDAVVKDAFQKEVEARKSLIYKWIDFAKEDIESLNVECKKKNEVIVEVESAFYDPIEK